MVGGASPRSRPTLGIGPGMRIRLNRSPPREFEEKAAARHSRNYAVSAYRSVGVPASLETGGAFLARSRSPCRRSVPALLLENRALSRDYGIVTSPPSSTKPPKTLRCDAVALPALSRKRMCAQKAAKGTKTDQKLGFHHDHWVGRGP